MHLEEEDLLDIAEGTRDESSAPHLTSCAACRQQLADLRATLASVADVDVPEPSPLFWDHFSRRIHDGVAAEGGPRRAWLPWLFPATAAVALLLLFVVVPGSRRSTDPLPLPPIARAESTPPRELLSDIEDPSLVLVADLTDGVGWEGEREAGLAPRGSAEHAVTHLTDSELRELQRLLQVELAHPTD